MRKQPPLLKDVADASAVHRHVDAGCGIKQRRMIELDVPAVGRNQPRDHVHQRCLSGARGAEQAGDPTFAFEARADEEFAQAFLHLQRQHAHSPWKRMPARRASHSAAIRAASEMMISTTTRRPAAASPPGIWVKV